MFVDDVADFLQATADVFGVFSDSSFHAGFGAGVHRGGWGAALKWFQCSVNVRGNRVSEVTGLEDRADRVLLSLSPDGNVVKHLV